MGRCALGPVRALPSLSTMLLPLGSGCRKTFILNTPTQKFLCPPSHSPKMGRLTTSMPMQRKIQVRNSVAVRPWQHRIASPSPRFHHAPKATLVRFTTQSFERFPDLPKELQILVWKYALQRIPDIDDLSLLTLYSMRDRKHLTPHTKSIILKTAGRTMMTFSHNYVSDHLFGILNASCLARQIAIDFWGTMVSMHMPNQPGNRY